MTLENNADSADISMEKALNVIKIYEEAFAEMDEHLCDSREDGNPCSQMWYQDAISEAKEKIRKILDGKF